MDQLIYVAHATSTSGRNGVVKTDDGALKLCLATPGTPTAKPGTTNPEQLFSCAYAGCFGSALDHVLREEGITGVYPVAQADVELHERVGKYFLSVVLNITIVGMEQEQAERLVQAANHVCPYSRALRGNIDITLRLNNQLIEVTGPCHDRH